MPIYITNNLDQNRLRGNIAALFIKQVFDLLPENHRLGKKLGYSPECGEEVTQSDVLDGFNNTIKLETSFNFGILTPKVPPLKPSVSQVFNWFVNELTWGEDVKPKADYIGHFEVLFNEDGQIAQVAIRVYGEQYLSLIQNIAHKIDTTYDKAEIDLTLMHHLPLKEYK